MKKIIGHAVAAAMALGFAFGTTAPVAAQSQGGGASDTVAQCKLLVEMDAFGSVGECTSFARTYPVEICKLFDEFGLLQLFGYKNRGACVSASR